MPGAREPTYSRGNGRDPAWYQVKRVPEEEDDEQDSSHVVRRSPVLHGPGFAAEREGIRDLFQSSRGDITQRFFSSYGGSDPGRDPGDDFNVLQHSTEEVNQLIPN